jgi:hypothetical protein
MSLIYTKFIPSHIILVHQREPLNNKLHKANPNQVCHHLGLLCILANPPLMPVDYKKCNIFGNLVVPLGPLDIIVVVHFQQKNSHLTSLAKPQ